MSTLKEFDDRFFEARRRLRGIRLALVGLHSGEATDPNDGDAVRAMLDGAIEEFGQLQDSLEKLVAADERAAA